VGEVIILPCSGEATLVLEEKSGVEWYGCSLRVSGADSYLGAESRGYLLAHLVHVADVSGSPIGEISGFPVRWVLSLAERHSSLYVHDSSPRAKLLFWQDAKGAVQERLELNDPALREWRRVLAGRISPTG
jgi:hypothetical protein